MEENINTKIIHTQNMNKFNFSVMLNISVDMNVNIKTILDVNTYLFDQKVECANGKAILSGKIGAKVLYLDTDNMTNILSESTSFSETYLDSTLTNETFLNMSNVNIVNNIISTEGGLKINCDVNIAPVAYINLPLTNNLQPSESLITKKYELKTNSISQFVNTEFSHSVVMETENTINKILCHNSYLTCEQSTAYDNYVLVEGKIISHVLYETIKNDDVLIKELKNVEHFKTDVELSGVSKDDLLDVSFAIDKSMEEVSTEIEDNHSVVTVKNSIKMCGVVEKSQTIEVVDDAYCIDSEIETTSAKRPFNKNQINTSVSDVVSNEMSLSSEEPAIDEVISNLNIKPEITNNYIKDNSVFVEGIITSNLTYIDENKEFKHKEVQVPFILNTKIQTTNLGCINANVSVVDYNVKIKRGTIIEIEYTVFASVVMYEKDSHEIVESITYKSPLDFSKYDFQIFVAKPNETTWELCKRIKILPEDLAKYNKDLPLIMVGGEKIVIKR